MFHGERASNDDRFIPENRTRQSGAFGKMDLELLAGHAVLCIDTTPHHAVGLVPAFIVGRRRGRYD